jgi:hypothetical protein
MLPNTDLNKDRSETGIYRINQHGRDFVEGRISVHRYTFTYYDEIHGISDEKTDIETAWGDGFNFTELMASVDRPPRTLRQKKPKVRKEPKVRAVRHKKTPETVETPYFTDPPDLVDELQELINSL